MLLQRQPCATALQQSLSLSAETWESTATSTVKSWNCKGQNFCRRSKAKCMVCLLPLQMGFSWTMHVRGSRGLQWCSVYIEEDVRKQSEGSGILIAFSSGLYNETISCLDPPALQSLHSFPYVASSLQLSIAVCLVNEPANHQYLQGSPG
jgi:hypothetical protein